LQKLNKISEKCQKNGLATLLLPMMFLGIIGEIGSHRLSGNIVGIGVIPVILPVTDSKVSLCYLVTLATNRKVRIKLYRRRSVTECPKLNLDSQY